MIQCNAKLLPYISLIFAFFTIPLFAQESDSPVQGRAWSISGSGSGNFPVSTSMRGTIEEFKTEVAKDYNNSKYPFANPQFALGWSVKLHYALPSSSHTDLFLGFNGNFIGSAESSNNNKAFLALWGINIGVEYSLLPRWNTWNAFARGSVSAQFLGGFTDYDNFFGTFRTKVPLAGRIGVEGELGGRFIIPSTPVGLELSCGYLNANLLGKSYTKPAVEPNAALYERQLNDGANPDNPNDNNRTIDFLSIRFGGRIWF